MVETARAVIDRQDVGDRDGIVELFAPDCTFMMPVLAEPIRGRDQLRQHVESWPTAATETEWIAVDGNRLVCAWAWRAEDASSEIPVLRGVSTFEFDADGLIRDYEDFFDPDWITRHAGRTADDR